MTVDGVKDAVAKVEPYDLNLLLAPTKGMTHDPDRLTDLIKRVGGFRIGSFPSFGHAEETSDPRETLRKLAPYAGGLEATITGKKKGLDLGDAVDSILSVGTSTRCPSNTSARRTPSMSFARRDVRWPRPSASSTRRSSRRCSKPSSRMSRTSTTPPRSRARKLVMMTRANATTASSGGEQMASATSRERADDHHDRRSCSTGKSTVAQRLSACPTDSLDTGAMYRAIALRSLELGIPPEDHAGMIEIADRVRLDFDWSASPPALLIDGVRVGDRIRREDVDERVSIIAGLPAIRSLLVRAQREIADKHPGLVTEGRDQGSVVFPDAQLRFYLDASPEVRARRRVQQLQQAGQSADLDEVLEAIKARDRRDESRSDGPLRVPEGATIVDTSELSLEEVVSRLVSIVEDSMRGELP